MCLNAHLVSVKLSELQIAKQQLVTIQKELIHFYHFYWAEG
jgi:hypothetical protein